MKAYITTLFAIALFFKGFAQQDTYTQQMVETMAKMDSAKTTAQLQACGAQFEKIAQAEKNKWLPYYYAALCNTKIGFMDSKIDKDALADKTKALLNKAFSIENNSELYCIKSIVATQQMLVNPMERFSTYGVDATEALEKAKKMDPSNPRIYLLEGSTVLHTPEQYGGGKEQALPILKKALSLYDSFKPASIIHPNWGKKLAEDLYAQANQ